VQFEAAEDLPTLARGDTLARALTTDRTPPGALPMSVPSDLFGREMIADPYPVYHRLRSTAPVLWAEPLKAWVLTRYDDVAAVLRDGSRFSSARLGAVTERLGRPELEGMLRMRAEAMINADAPKHTRLRSLVSKAFTPKAVEAMRPTIQALVDDHLEAAASSGGPFDLMRALANPLPVMVIAAMLGVPPDDRERFKGWSDAIAVVANISLGLGEDVLDRAATAYRELTDYFRGAVGRMRGDPGEDAGLLAAMAAAQEQGERLSEGELYANAILLLNAGHETTTNLIGNGTLALLRHPDQMRRLRAEPALLGNAVEELLRFDSPVQFTTRIPTEDLELGGQRIAARQPVLCVLGAANRDPAHFPDPDRLDLGREDVHHVAFGLGPHYCLGAPLARLEGAVAFSTLLHRVPELHLADGRPPEYRDNFNLRGLKELRVESSASH
jgi:cytochrome P450